MQQRKIYIFGHLRCRRVCLAKKSCCSCASKKKKKKEKRWKGKADARLGRRSDEKTITLIIILLLLLLLFCYRSSRYRPPPAAMMMMEMMPMFFTSGHDVGKLLFKGWVVDTPSRYALAWMLIFMLSVTNEFLGYLRQMVCSSTSSKKSGYLLNNHENGAGYEGRTELTLMKKLFLIILYFINVSISYGLMLVTMTYNVGLFFAVVLGLTLGHFIFKISLPGRKAYYGEWSAQREMYNIRGLDQELGGY